MKNPASYIRTKLIALLHNTITYESVTIPAYSGNGEVTQYQILVRDATDTDTSNRDSFNGKWRQIIEVVSEQETNIRKHVDAIGNEVLNILIPTPALTSLTGNTDFQIAVVRKEGQRYIDEQSGEGTYINRLIITITFLVTQKLN